MMNLQQALKKAIKLYGQGSSIHVFLDHEHRGGKKWEEIIDIVMYNPHEVEIAHSDTNFEDLFKDAERIVREGR